MERAKIAIAQPTWAWTATAILCVGVLLAAIPSSAHAMGPKLSVGRRSDLVVEGKVVDRKAAWGPGRRLIYTYTKVRVDRELKGEAPGYVTIKQPGGKIGKLRLIVSDRPAFVTGEEAKVYLEKETTTTFDVVNGPGAKQHLSGPATKNSLTGGEARAGSGYTWDGTKWYSSDLPMRYYINTAFNSTERSVIQSAFNTWESDPDSSMSYDYGGTTTRGGPVYDGYNVMTKGSTGGSIATTYYWASGGRMIDVDIVYDYVAWYWSTSGEAGKFDLQNIATHENGHTLVLGDLYDSGNTEQTMYGYAGLGETKKRSLYWGDRAGVAAVYPDTGPPANVSGFTATAGDEEVILSWSNPSAADFAGVQIVRKPGSAPESRADGTTVYDGAGTRYVDTGLTNETTYYYSAFAYDDSGHYAAGVTASASPRLASTLTASAGHSVIMWGASTRVLAVLLPSHSPAPTVRIQQSGTGSSWATLAYMSWDGGTEAYQYAVAPSANTYYRAVWSGDSDHLPATSSDIVVRVIPRLRATVSASAIRYGSAIWANAYISPRHYGKTAQFYFDRRTASGSWRYRAYRAKRFGYNSSTRSKASLGYRPTARGTWRVRLRFRDWDHVAQTVYSPTFRVR